MTDFLKRMDRLNIFYGLCLVFLVSLFYSKFLLSVSMFGFFFLSWTDKNLRLSSIKTYLKNFTSRYYFWPFTLVLLSMVFSIINSENLGYWWHHVQLKLPFLVLPLAFASFTFLNKSHLWKIVRVFVVISVITAFHTLICYFLRFDYYNDLISKGQSLYTPVQHVNYSLMIAFAAIISMIDFMERKNNWSLVAGFFLFVFIHVLAVRTGMVAMYAGLMALVFSYTLINKKYLQGLGMIVFCFAIPIIAYFCLPSFANKLDYMIWDLTQMINGKTADYSDGGRIVSLQLGLDLFKAQPWLGTGIGDFKEACLDWYLNSDLEFKGKNNFPHNQFLYSLASTGIIGFFLYQLAFIIPFFVHKLYKNYLSLILYIVIYVSFLVETSLERSFGIAFFLFFVLLIIRSTDEHHETNKLT